MNESTGGAAVMDGTSSPELELHEKIVRKMRSMGIPIPENPIGIAQLNELMRDPKLGYFEKAYGDSAREKADDS